MAGNYAEDVRNCDDKENKRDIELCNGD